MGEPPPILFVSCFCREVQRPELADRTPTRSSPVPVEKASLVGAVCGNNNSFTNKGDLLVTYDVNSEYKQEPRQSPKDARPARPLR